MVELSEEAQSLLLKIQTQNQQLQELIAQKQNLEMHKQEIDEAMREINNKEEVYRELAGVLIKADKENIQQELEEEKEMISVRKKQTDSKEEQLKTELEDDQKKLMSFVQNTKLHDKVS